MSTEIEKLERRWQDNPHGLTFAPLAEAYRKNGALARALELLDTGLAQHPGYVPAHIVRGRCHLDSGERALAELDFLCVSELDPENAIALKALADLAEEEGRTSDAIRRLESLLEIDRDNEEAEGQLDRLRAEQNPPPVPVSDFRPRNDSAALTPSAVRLEGIELLELEKHLPAVSDAETASLSGLVIEAAALEEPLLVPTEPAQAESAAIEIDSSLLMEDVEETIEEPPPVASLEEAPPHQGLADLPSELTAWLEDPIPVPDTATTETTKADDPVEPVEAIEPIEPIASFETVEPLSDSSPDVEEPAAPESEPEPELVVTETMAEIFLRQGHQELALAVYAQLLQREPDNSRIAAALAGLTESLAPPPPPPPPEPPPEPVKRYDAASTGGTAVKEFLTALLAVGRPKPATTVHPPAFDREVEERAPSFDEFFATESPPAPAAAAIPAAPHGQRAEVGPRTGEAEELEQFHAWLRGLKS